MWKTDYDNIRGYFQGVVHFKIVVHIFIGASLIEYLTDVQWLVIYKSVHVYIIDIQLGNIKSLLILKLFEFCFQSYIMMTTKMTRVILGYNKVGVWEKNKSSETKHMGIIHSTRGSI